MKAYYSINKNKNIKNRKNSILLNNIYLCYNNFILILRECSRVSKACEVKALSLRFFFFAYLVFSRQMTVGLFQHFLIFLKKLYNNYCIFSINYLTYAIIILFF